MTREMIEDERAFVDFIVPCASRGSVSVFDRSRTETADASALTGWLYAHRGLHGGDVPENSLAAFSRAVEAGYGIELDVQLTRDGFLVVHHDASLKRVCGADLRICDITFEELCRHPLPDGRACRFSATCSRWLAAASR